MKTIGLTLFTVGFILMMYALLIMDTSVPVDYPAGNSYGLPDRVNNLGLMSQRQSYLIASGIIIIIGIVIAFTAKPTSESIQKVANEYDKKKCPQCAELIKKEAKICRFCNYKFTEEELKEKKIDKYISIPHWYD